jgi:deazaflavin-dependent oxidoreductase (nitroreductase family)
MFLDKWYLSVSERKANRVRDFMLVTKITRKDPNSYYLSLKVNLVIELRREVLEKALLKGEEIEIGFTGRKSGRTFKIPVWFTYANRAVYLLPLKGSRTNWYRNVLLNPRVTLKIDSEEIEVTARPITDKERIDEVISSFCTKYGVGEVKKYYTGLDAAIEIPIPEVAQ